jgi:hypothetical protein
MALDELEAAALALFDMAQGSNVFERLEACRAEQAVVTGETAQLSQASDTLESEIIALDEQRTSLSKLIDAAFPPEAKQAAEKVFMTRFDQYYAKVREVVERHITEAHSLELQTVQKLTEAQRIELEQIQLLKKT